MLFERVGRGKHWLETGRTSGKPERPHVNKKAGPEAIVRAGSNKTLAELFLAGVGEELICANYAAM